MNFTLPYRCDCGATGRITFEQYEDLEGEPQPRVVDVEGPFRALSGTKVACTLCEPWLLGREGRQRQKKAPPARQEGL